MSRDIGRCTDWVRSRRQYETCLALMTAREDASEAMMAALRERIIRLSELIDTARQTRRQADP